MTIILLYNFLHIRPEIPRRIDRIGFIQPNIGVITDQSMILLQHLFRNCHILQLLIGQDINLGFIKWNISNSIALLRHQGLIVRLFTANLEFLEAISNPLLHHPLRTHQKHTLKWLFSRHLPSTIPRKSTHESIPQNKQIIKQQKSIPFIPGSEIDNLLIEVIILILLEEILQQVERDILDDQPLVELLDLSYEVAGVDEGELELEDGGVPSASVFLGLRS